LKRAKPDQESESGADSKVAPEGALENTRCISGIRQGCGSFYAIKIADCQLAARDFGGFRVFAWRRFPVIRNPPPVQPVVLLLGFLCLVSGFKKNTLTAQLRGYFEIKVLKNKGFTIRQFFIFCENSAFFDKAALCEG